MNAQEETHPLELSAIKNSISGLRFGIASLVGGALCIGGTITQEELIAYAGLGQYFILGGISLAYRAGADDDQNELRRINGL